MTHDMRTCGLEAEVTLVVVVGMGVVTTRRSWMQRGVDGAVAHLLPVGPVHGQVELRRAGRDLSVPFDLAWAALLDPEAPQNRGQAVLPNPGDDLHHPPLGGPQAALQGDDHAQAAAAAAA